MAYCGFGLGIAMLMQLKNDDAMKLFLDFGPNMPYAFTPSAPRALLEFANIKCQSKDREDDYKEGMRAYQYIANTYPDTQESSYAEYYLGRCYYYLGNKKMCRKILEKYISKHKERDFYDYAKAYLDALEN